MLLSSNPQHRFRQETQDGNRVRGAVIWNMMQLRPAGSWAHKKSAHPSPRRDGATGSIGLGIFDEPERGRTKVSQTRSRVRTARPSWPLSARLLVGAMFVLNIFLAAFLVRTEIKRPEARPEQTRTGNFYSAHTRPTEGRFHAADQCATRSGVKPRSEVQPRSENSPCRSQAGRVAQHPEGEAPPEDQRTACQ